MLSGKREVKTERKSGFTRLIVKARAVTVSVTVNWNGENESIGG